MRRAGWIATAVAAVVLTAGCSTPLPVPQTITVPVPVACVSERVPRPDFVTDQALVELDDWHGMLGLWLDRRARQIYIARLEAAMAGCWQVGAGGT